MLNMKIHGDALNLGRLQYVPGIGQKRRVSSVRRTWGKFQLLFQDIVFSCLVRKGRFQLMQKGLSSATSTEKRVVQLLALQCLAF